MNQITMRRVQLQPLTARRQRPLRRSDKLALHASDVRQAHRAWNLGQFTTKSQRARRDDRPAARVIRQVRAAFPRSRG